MIDYTTIFTWLNAMATITNLRKITVANIQGCMITSQGRQLLQCNNDRRSYYSKPGKMCSTNS